MPPIFACSFDAGTPLGGWTTSAGVTIVPSRNVNGGKLVLGSPLTLVGALTANPVIGIGYEVTIFSNLIFQINDTSGGGGFTGGFVKVGHLQDGRLFANVGSSLGNTTVNFTNVGFAAQQSVYAYYEAVTQITQSIVPVTGSTSTLQITVTVSVYANDVLIGTASDTHSTGGAISNAFLPLGIFDTFKVVDPITGGTAVVDDIYLNASRIGDCFVQSDDTTITVETSAPDVTQTLIEVGTTLAAPAPVLTQSPIEVGLRLATLSIACPLGGGVAQVGVFYSAQIVVAGDNPPDNFVIISGALPPGVTLNALTGLIEGIPTAVGIFSYTPKVIDSLGNSATVDAPCQISVGGPQPPQPPPFCIVPTPIPQENLILYPEPLENQGT